MVEFLPGDKDHQANYIDMVCVNKDCGHEEKRFKSTRKCRQCGGRVVPKAVLEGPKRLCFAGDCQHVAIRECPTCIQWWCNNHYGSKVVCTYCNSPYRMWPPEIIKAIRKLKR